MVLSNFFLSFAPGYFTGKRVLELGAGTGLVGLVAYRLGVPLRDREFIPDLMFTFFAIRCLCGSHRS